MIDVTLVINGRNFSARLSTYRVQKELTTSRVITALDGTEYVKGKRRRDVLTFSLIPFDEETSQADYDALKELIVEATYTVPQEWTSKTQTMRVTTNLDAVFGLRSANGRRYYKGGSITLRAKEAQ